MENRMINSVHLVYAIRLMRLTMHLFHGKLNHEVFDMTVWNDGGTVSNPCGTKGCAIGECPAVFEEWEYRLGRSYTTDDENYYFPVLKTMPDFPNAKTPGEAAAEFFGLTEREVEALFVPSVMVRNFDVENLFDETITTISLADFSESKIAVAKMLREFIHTKYMKFSRKTWLAALSALNKEVYGKE